MIDRRSFLVSLAVQPLVINSIIKPASQNQHQYHNSDSDESDCIVVGGWILMKSDLLEIES